MIAGFLKVVEGQTPECNYEINSHKYPKGTTLHMVFVLHGPHF
jgi:hypothetical protein